MALFKYFKCAKCPIKHHLGDIKKANESVTKELDTKDHVCFLFFSHSHQSFIMQKPHTQLSTAYTTACVKINAQKLIAELIIRIGT